MMKSASEEKSSVRMCWRSYSLYKITEDSVRHTTLFLFEVFQNKKLFSPENHTRGEHLVNILNKTTFSNDVDSFPRTHAHVYLHVCLYTLIKANSTLTQMCWSKTRRTGNILSFSSSTSELQKERNTATVCNTPIVTIK